MTASAKRTWTAVCPVGAVPEWGGVAALLDGAVQVAIFRLPAGDFYGLSNMDPMSGAAVLSRGIVGDRKGVPKIASPLYKQSFDLRNGQCLDDAAVRVRAYEVRVRGGRIEVGPEKPAAPA